MKTKSSTFTDMRHSGISVLFRNMSTDTNLFSQGVESDGLKRAKVGSYLSLVFY